MGNRLIKFLSEVLPTHHHYYSKQPEIVKLRIKIQNDLLHVRNQIEDLAFLFDEEVYKSVMRMQGLEYHDDYDSSIVTPPTKQSSNAKNERKKMVTFASEEILHQYDADNHHLYDEQEESHQQQQHQQRVQNESNTFQHERRTNEPIHVPPQRLTKNLRRNNPSTIIANNDITRTAPSSSSSYASIDLSLWEDRDPGIEIVDLSMSSCDNSSIDFDNRSLEAESTTTVTIGEISSESTQEDVVNRSHNSMERGDVDTSQEFDGTNMFDSMNDDGWESFQCDSESEFQWPQIDPFQQTHNNTTEELRKESTLDEVVSSSSTQQEPRCHIVQQDSLIEEEDSDDHSDQPKNDDDFHDQYDTDDSHYLYDMDEGNVSFVEKIAMENINLDINELREDGGDSDTADSWEQNDDDEKTPIDLDHSNCSTVSLSMEGSLMVSDTSMERDIMMNRTDPDEHLEALHEEFMSNDDVDQFVDYDDDGDDSESCITDKQEHNHIVEKVAAVNFPDEIPACDSSGADKTVVTSSTAETESMTADDESEDSKSLNETEESIIGITRRDDFYPSFDSPERDSSIELPTKLDYLEYKVKDLKVKQENKINSISSCIESHSESSIERNSPYPVQMALPTNINENNDVSETKTDTDKNCSVIAAGTESTPNERIKTRPTTASRLKHLRNTTAWKRRFGTSSTQ